MIARSASRSARHMAEVEITSEELLRRVDEWGRRDNLDQYGFVGGRLTQGWATRVVSTIRGSYTDKVLFHTSERDRRGIGVSVGGSVRVIARTQFDIVDPLGPVIVSDRVLPATIDDPVEWVSWAVDAIETAEQRDEGRQPLPDDAFWELVHELGGEVGEASAERLARLLADLSDHMPYDFMDALDRKLFELDAPGNTVGLTSDPTEIDHDASLMYRCEIIARGRAAFEAHVRDPRPGVPGVDGLSTPELLYVYEDATGQPLPVRSWPISTGTNPQFWPDAEPLRPSRRRVDDRPAPGPFSARVQLESIFGGGKSGWPRGFVAFVTGPSHVRELLGSVVDHTEEGRSSRCPRSSGRAWLRGRRSTP
ncbi:hypothetical protein GCM10025877_25890 [Agromyces mangrovi Wang et al. 2018]|nr:hypothetical protein GCM10025877_25890 [Agromyces mangrovi]